MMDLSISAYVRYALEMMSDRTVLSAIANIDFENQNVTIRSGYWKTFVLFVNSNNKAKNIASTLRHLKILFIERFAQCSANSVKDYFLGKLKRSYFDFRNILVYIDEHESNWLNRKKQFKILRSKRFFERKAQRYYDYQKKLFVVNQDNDPTVVDPNISDEINSDSESQLSESIPVDIPSTNDVIEDFFDPIEKTVVIRNDSTNLIPETRVSEVQSYDYSSSSRDQHESLFIDQSSSLTVVNSGSNISETQSNTNWQNFNPIIGSVEQVGSSTMIEYPDGTTRMYHNGKWY